MDAQVTFDFGWCKLHQIIFYKMLYGKLQSYSGEEFLIKRIPVLLSNVPCQEGIRIMDCRHYPQRIATLEYKNHYILRVHTECVVDQQFISMAEVRLENFSRIYLPCQHCNHRHFFTFVLPQQIRTLGTLSPHLSQASGRTHDKALYARWSPEDKEALKRLVLQFGYGRWNKLRSLRFLNRPKSEIRAFANALLRSIVELLPAYDLGAALSALVEEAPEDPYIEASQRDWELQNLKQKLLSISKRLLMLSHIRQFIKRFKEHQACRDKSQIKWDYLLGFVPSSAFYSQRPSIWWTRKHDSDLIRGVYKYGYTNHQQIKEAPDLCFKDLATSTTYQEFPFPETLNKRVKKLVQIIQKYEGNYDFDQLAQSDDEEEKSWSMQEKQVLFQLLCDFGVPIGVDGRQCWQDLKDRLTQKLGKFDKNLSQLEKMVQTIRTRCEQILMKHKETEYLESESSDLDSKQFEMEQPQQQQTESTLVQECQFQQQAKQPPEQQLAPQQLVQKSVLNNNNNHHQHDQFDEFQISYQDSQNFSKHTNMLHFIRKNIMPQLGQLFQQYSNQIEREVPTQIPSYDPKLHDIQLLTLLSSSGFTSLNQFKVELPVDYNTLLQRIEQLCSFFKKVRDQLSAKRKPDKALKDEIQKKIRTSATELTLPCQVNGSLRLLALGRIIPTPAYHSEHNLFPVGYKSIRSYSSMFNKGKRCAYTCEILEGSDGKPIFKVTSEEDPENPIIKSSCTGCWVYICNKVNDLSDHKKSKVTISGTDRFGLLEPNVQRYLEELPNAELCTKYKFKYRVQMQDF